MILDTNALSAIADGETSVAAEAGSAAVLAIPSVVLGEFRFGVAQSRRRAEYEQWLDESLSYYQLLEIGARTAVFYAQVRLELKLGGTPIPTNDTWIAALCRQHSLPVLSRDRRFDLVKGVRRITW